jgi:hypothetical protein
MNYGPFAQKWGATSTDGRLAVFPDQETGFKAMGGLLDLYRDKHGLDSVSGIINRWAPRQYDNNSTDTYIRTVASKLGVDPNTPVSPDKRNALMEAMATYEAGRPVTMGGASQPQPITPTGAAAMAAPVDYSNMPSPEQVAMSRRMGQQLMQQGTSTEPVGHWTQALARVLQGGVGRAHLNEAETQQREANAGVASMLSGNPTPQQLVANPYTRDIGQSLWLAQAKSKIQGPEEYGKTGAVFEGPDRRFYSIQFGSRGERIVKPVEADGKPLVPAKGVTQIGDEMMRNADGSTVRNVGPQIANREAQEQIGTARGKTTAAAPKTLGAQADLERQHTVVNNDIDRAMKEIDWKSTGIVGGLLQAVPGTPAYALAQKIATIKANIGFDKLAEMRANSPTGSALGSVTERELAFLQSVFGSLEQAQNAEDIKYNLRRLKDYLKDSSSSRRKVIELELRNAGVNDAGLTGTVGVREQAAPQPAAPAQPAPNGGFSMRRVD